MHTAEQQTEFCDVYDELLAHYQALCVTETEAEPTRRRHQAVNWLNRMLATEPAVGFDGKVMVDFYFSKEQFATINANTQSHYKKLVAINAFYLVLVALNQRKRARGMCQTVVQGEAGWERIPQPLMTGMYQPPESAFAKRYSEQTFRFPCTIAELYLDVKAASKQYSTGVQACRSKKEGAISFETPRAFALSVSAMMDELNDHAIYQREALACFATFELLPNNAK